MSEGKFDQKFFIAFLLKSFHVHQEFFNLFFLHWKKLKMKHSENLFEFSEIALKFTFVSNKFRHPKQNLQSPHKK